MSHQRSDGGWSWWYYGDSADALVTSYVLEYLVKARDAGIEFNEEIINKAQRFFENRKLNEADEAYQQYALALTNAEIDRKPITNFNNLSVDDLSVAVLANVKNGYKDAKTNGLDKLQSMAQEEGGLIYWPAGKKSRFGSYDVSTALAIRAIVAGNGDRVMAEKAIRYLMRNRKSNRWSNTYATARVIQALVDFSSSGEELSPNYTYTVKLDGEKLEEGRVSEFNQNDSLIIPADKLKDNGSQITVSQKGKGNLYASLVAHELFTDKDIPAKNNGMTIERKYVNTKGENYSVGVGDIVDVQLTISGLSNKERYIVIEDELPSGLVPINPRFKNEQRYGDNSPYGRYYYGGREITENGMILSLYWVRPGEHTYSYQARAVAEGVYGVLPAKTSLMYSPEINGHTATEILAIGPKAEMLYELEPTLPKSTGVFEKKKSEKIKTIYLILGGSIVLIILAVVTVILIRKRKNKEMN